MKTWRTTLSTTKTTGQLFPSNPPDHLPFILAPQLGLPRIRRHGSDETDRWIANPWLCDWCGTLLKFNISTCPKCKAVAR